MPLNSTKNFVQSLKDFFTSTTDSLLSSQAFPRWKPSPEIKSETVEKESEGLLRKEISKKKLDQNPVELVAQGNNYYFSLGIKKSYRLFTRSRIENVAINKSGERGLADDEGFLETKYKMLGDAIGPNEVPEKGN